MDNTDLLEGLEDLNLEADTSEKSAKEEKPAKVSSTLHYDLDRIKRLMKKEQIFVIKNMGKNDIVTDWDLPLMPAELHDKFDKYLEEQYTKFELPPTWRQAKTVAILVDGNKTVNFLHQFMTEQKIPSLETITVGKEVLIKSQCIIPINVPILVTQKQWESLSRFHRSRMTTAAGTSDWDGVLALKENVTEEDLQKIPYSIIFVEDIKKADFSAGKINENPLRRDVTYEKAEFEL